MDTESQNSDTEEEIYMYIQLEQNTNLTENSSINILGIEEKNPVIQIDDQVFIGKNEQALGTWLFMGEDEKNMKYLAHTRKMLTVSRACVRPKFQNDTEEASTSKMEVERALVEPIKKVEDGMKKILAEQPWKIVRLPENLSGKTVKEKFTFDS